jgi:hypothetical protein
VLEIFGSAVVMEETSRGQLSEDSTYMTVDVI